MINWDKNTQALTFYLKQVFKPNDIILSYTNSQTPGMMMPVVIRKAKDIDQIELNSFCVQNNAVYLSEFFQQDILSGNPIKGKWFITIKPCDFRSVLQMVSDEQIAKEKIEIIVFDCDGTISINRLKEKTKEELREMHLAEGLIQATTMTGKELSVNAQEVLQKKCSNSEICSMPSSDGFTFIGENDKPAFPGTTQPMMSIQDSLSQDECFDRIKGELLKCIRCNACRNICPACFCSENCIMDKPKLPIPYITKEIIPEQIFQYHMIRFFHVAPNCTACGECERVCPQGITLSIFYQYLHKLNVQAFGTEAGSSESDKQKLLSYRFGEDLL